MSHFRKIDFAWQVAMAEHGFPKPKDDPYQAMSVLRRASVISQTMTLKEIVDYRDKIYRQLALNHETGRS